MLLGAGHFCKTPFRQSFLRYKAFKMARKIHIIIPLNTSSSHVNYFYQPKTILPMSERVLYFRGKGTGSSRFYSKE
jgi:hypothetical protein